MKRKYKVIEHTADLGIHVFGKDAEALYTNAAYALFDQITDMNRLEGKNQKSITIGGEDWPDLMVNWLRELLFLWNGEEQLVKTVDITFLTEQKLSADIYYDRYDAARHDIKLEIKAVTYHLTRVAEKASSWQAEVIFDV